MQVPIILLQLFEFRAEIFHHLCVALNFENAAVKYIQTLTCLLVIFPFPFKQTSTIVIGAVEILLSSAHKKKLQHLYRLMLRAVTNILRTYILHGFNNFRPKRKTTQQNYKQRHILVILIKIRRAVCCRQSIIWERHSWNYGAFRFRFFSSVIISPMNLECNRRLNASKSLIWNVIVFHLSSIFRITNDLQCAKMNIDKIRARKCKYWMPEILETI